MMQTKRNLAALVAVCLIGLFMFGCMTKPLQQGNVTQENNTNATIANPASVYCEQHGGTLSIVTAADGSQSGLCVFPNGSQCDEWAYYRGECAPTNQTAVNASANASGLDESDFLVVDDSMPNVFTDEQTTTVPETPQ